MLIKRAVCHPAFGCPYEEWKLIEVNLLQPSTALSDVPMRNGNYYVYHHFNSSSGPFGCPYEEWKLLLVIVHPSIICFLSDVPMRNGNPMTSMASWCVSGALSDVPMRNGNFLDDSSCRFLLILSDVPMRNGNRPQTGRLHVAWLFRMSL